MSSDKKLQKLVILLETLLVIEERGGHSLILDHEGGKGSKDADVLEALKLGLAEKRKFSPPKRFANAFRRHYDGISKPRRRLHLTDAGRMFYEDVPIRYKGRSEILIAVRLYDRLPSKYEVRR